MLNNFLNRMVSKTFTVAPACKSNQREKKSGQRHLWSPAILLEGIQADGDHDLKALELLLDEFFAPGTAAPRQREIESILLGFGSQRGAWNHCLGFMSRTSNQYVSMFCLTTMETVINRQWQGLPWEERVQLKSALNNLALQKHRSIPPFIRNKLVKLVVDIARHDWPHFYPDFLNNIIQLIQSSEHTALGLVFALTASEELVSPREDLSSARRDELRRLLLAQVPELFSALTGVLEKLLDQQKIRVTATPPPSPTHGQPENGDNGSQSGSLLSGMLARLGAAQPGRSSSSTMDDDSYSLCSLALQALTHLFSWVPLANYLTPQLMAVLFQYASMPSQGQISSRPEVSGPSLGVRAMGAINELLYKQCVPSEWQDLMLEMFSSAFSLLQKLLSDGLDTVEEIYLEKFSEFLRLFVGFHLHRFEGNDRFPLSEFLSLLYRFTFQQPMLDGQVLCLETWRQLINYLSARLQDRVTDRQTVIDWYQEALVSLSSQLLQSIQYRHNQSRLEELDDETMDNDDQTEWQHYLCQHIETVAKIADILPLQTYVMVLEAWETASAEYVRLGSNVGPRLQEHEASRLHCVLRDLSSLSQALGRLCAGLEAEPGAALAVSQRLVHLASFGARTKIYLPSLCPAQVLQPDLLTVHAQVLAALKAWAPWLGTAIGDGHTLALEAVRAALASLGSVGQDPAPPLVAHTAAHLLLSLSTSLRSPELGNMPEFQALMRQAPILPGLQDEARCLVLRALANTLLLPWAGRGDQQWHQRQNIYCGLIVSLASGLQGLGVTPGQPIARDKVVRLVSCLSLLTDQVENLREEGSATKRSLALAIGPAVQQCLELFPMYGGQPEACEALLSLFLAVFGALQPQLGAGFAERMAQVFLEVFTGERLAAAILQQEAGQGPCVVDKFLKILQLMIQEPSQAFKRFVPSTITLCMDHIFPLVAEHQCPDVKLALLELIFHILMHNWRLFFCVTVRRTSPLDKENNAPSQDPLPVQHKDQLLRMLRAFGHCLLQPDIAAFRLSLDSLERLNTKWKLYHKTVFREELLQQFLLVLLNSLLERSHALLQDEVTVSLHSMACVDFDNFHARFLPNFLGSTAGLDNSQRQVLVTSFKLETDLPSFSQGILRLVNDMRCYRLCNTSLPDGGVHL